MRTASINRKTGETDIYLALNLDGKGESKIDTGIGFLNHMLTLFAKHGRFDLEITCKGDTDVDFHHSAEDIGICLGAAFAQALGDKKGIVRYGSAIIPMDEALILTAIDISGRSCLVYGLDIPTEKIGEFDSELIEEFFAAFVRNCPCSLHIRQPEGRNAHHIAEGAFKSFARCLKEAVAIDKDFANEIPSTKGVL